jgi:elongation factor G
MHADDYILKIRNIGIAAHIDAGKTTTTERILYFTGKTKKIGEVHEGEATMDFMSLEAEKGITIKSAATKCLWRDHEINIIDTPGHVDFTVEVERSLRVMDSCVLVCEAVAGVESQTETVFLQARKYGCKILFYINKLDRAGARYMEVIGHIQAKLTKKAITLHYPLYDSEARFTGFIDLVSLKEFFWKTDDKGEIPVERSLNDEQLKAITPFRIALLNMVLQTDSMVEEYLAIESKDVLFSKVSLSKLKAEIRSAVIQDHIIPILCGSSFKNKGITQLLDAVVDYLPSPKDMDSQVSSLLPAKLLCFKVTHTQFTGAIFYCRVYNGTFKKGDVLYVNQGPQHPQTGSKERVSRIVVLHANVFTNLEIARAGDIVALMPLNFTSSGATLSSEKDSEPLAGIDIPIPVAEVSITPATPSDRDGFGSALKKMLLEDPSFQLDYSDTGQTILRGMGELHLQILIELLHRDYNVKMIAGSPRVSYREMLSQNTIITAQIKKQTGGHGQYAKVVVEFIITDREADVSFESKVVGGHIPREYWPAVERGIKAEASRGHWLGFKFVGFKAALLDGDYHDVDSSDFAFENAGRLAFRECMLQQQPVILEPIMRAEVVVPTECTGPIIGDLSSRRAIINSTVDRDGLYNVITVDVPLANMFGYIDISRALTKGRAQVSMVPIGYEKMPEALAKEAIAQAKSK